MKINILVADDDRNILELIKLYLEKENYLVYSCLDGKNALDILEDKKIDLAIIDIMMPKMDGWDLCQEIKRLYEIPVIMVTAKSEPYDKIKGFQLGTDDYLAKPFHPVELVMRVKAVLKRYNKITSEKLIFKRFEIDSSSLLVKIDNENINLPLKQFELLYTLASTPGQIYSRDQLIDKIWGYDYEGDDRTVDTHIKKLRKSFNEYENIFSISTIRGLGYKLEVLEK
ncbi:MAG: DNA-binding response regulator [Bacillales bacterium]|jgi:DNA-binding response OmpR family regulator|nr:DNA-binding response regulator [Bacillales bacterium]